jgi:MarR family transcriptional regulator, temperature-dependent positive regulator of motility
MAKDDTGKKAALAPVAVAHLLHRAQQAGADLQAGMLDEVGLTLRQLTVLQALAASDGPLTQAGLVAGTGIDRSTLAEMVARMETRGLIARTSADEDRRAKSVSLTEAGRAQLSAASGLAAQADTALLKRIPRKHRELFLELLHRITLPVDDRKAGKKAKKDKGAGE